MKVVFLARYLPQEGSTTHMYSLAKGLIDRGNEVHIISAGPKKNEGAKYIFDEVISYGVKHHKVNFPLDITFDKKGKIIQLFSYMFSIPGALKILFSISPDVIHVHYPVTSFIAKIYCTLTGKKFLTTHHTTGIPKHPLHWKANFVIAISRELEKELISKFNYKQDQVKLIFNGVSEKRFSQSKTKIDKNRIKEELGIPKDKIIIGYVGTLSYRKGIDILFKAISELDNDLFHLCLVGDGDDRWINNLIELEKIKKEVSIFPFQDPIDFYNIFDIFVLASRQEGFPLVPLEAMMMGIPTIRSNVEGALDQIVHYKSGFIFENENYKQLKKYIDMLIFDKELRSEMGANAKKYILENYTETIMLEKLLEVYTTVVNGRFI